MSQSKIPKWVGKEEKRLAEERAKIFEEKGWKEFFKFPVGTTRVIVDLCTKPRATKEGKPILRMRIAGAEWDVPVSPVVYQKIIRGISDNGCIEYDVIRVGEGKVKGDTKYDVIPVE